VKDWGNISRCQLDSSSEEAVQSAITQERDDPMILTTEQLSTPAMVRLCPEALVRHLQGSSITLHTDQLSFRFRADGQAFFSQTYARRDNLLRALRSLGLQAAAPAAPTATETPAR
jgi:hypothetical protein